MAGAARAPSECSRSCRASVTDSPCQVHLMFHLAGCRLEPQRGATDRGCDESRAWPRRCAFDRSVSSPASMVAHPPSPRDMLCLIASNLCACFLFLDPAGRQPGTNRARHYEREQIITAANDQKTWGPGISAGTIASRDSPPPRSPLPPPPPRSPALPLTKAPLG